MHLLFLKENVPFEKTIYVAVTSINDIWVSCKVTNFLAITNLTHIY